MKANTMKKDLYAARLNDGTFFNTNIIWKYGRIMWQLKPHKRLTNRVLYADPEILMQEVTRFKLEGVTLVKVNKEVKLTAPIAI